MKKAINHLLTAMIIMLFTVIAIQSSAQETPPPPSDKGTGGNKAPGGGGGAPIEGGVAVSLALVAGYGAWKFMKTRKKEAEI